MTSLLLSEVGRGEETQGSILPDVSLSPQEVGVRIARAREEKKPKPWSQFDLALALNVSPSTIYRWEKGKLPSTIELLRLAEVLDKPSDYLTEPPERRTEFADLHEALEGMRRPLVEVREEAERSRLALLEALTAIDVRLSQIEERLDAQDGLETIP